MKLNPDCIRDILIYLEDNIVYENVNISLKHKFINIYDISDALSKKYNKEEILYSVEDLMKSGYVHYCNVDHDKYGCIMNADIDDVTSIGHEFINNVRSNNVWEATKNGVKKLESFSVGILSSVASSILTKFVTSPEFINPLVEAIKK